MPTSYTTRTPVTSSYTTRNPVSTTYSGRLQGSYLVDVAGSYICDYLGNRIVVLSPYGTMNVNTTTYTVRTAI